MVSHTVVDAEVILSKFSYVEFEYSTYHNEMLGHYYTLSLIPK